jgi:hypothetical protein
MKHEFKGSELVDDAATIGANGAEPVERYDEDL